MKEGMAMDMTDVSANANNDQQQQPLPDPVTPQTMEENGGQRPTAEKVRSAPFMLNEYPRSQSQAKLTNEIKQFRDEIAKIPWDLTIDNSEYLAEAMTTDRACEKWLIARGQNVGKAVSMFKEATTLRAKEDVDHRINRPCPSAQKFTKLDHILVHGFAKNGLPIYIQRQGAANVSEVLAAGTPEQRLDGFRHKAEYLRKVVFPAASLRAGRRIDQLFVIVDMKGFGMQHMRPGQFSFVQRMSASEQLVYPERTYKVVMINVPRVFSMVWKVVQPWLDQRLRDKFTIVSGPGKNELMQHIEPDQLPALLEGSGGTCQCEGGCMEGYPIQRLMMEAAETGLAHEQILKHIETISRMK